MKQENLFKALDELRKLQKITVSDLCNGVIDERSYYRYVNEGRSGSLTVFGKLLENMNVPPQLVLIYLMHFRTNTPAANYLRFIYRSHVQKYDDIEPMYEQLKTAKDLEPKLAEIVNIYILKYEYDRNIISSDEYTLRLEELVSLNENAQLDIMNIYAPLFLFKHKPSQEMNKMPIFYEFIKKHDYTYSPVLSAYLYDTYLEIAVNNPNLKLMNFKEVYDKLSEIIIYIPSRFLVGKQKMYMAYLKHANKEDFIDELSYFVNNAIAIYTQNQIKYFFHLIEETFKINPTSLLFK